MLNFRSAISAVFTLFLLLSVSACRNETGDFRPVDVSGWEYGDTLHYNIAAADSTTMHGDLAIIVRHTAAYPYSNIWLEVSYPQAEEVVSDTVNIVLADDFGNWYGRGAGLSYQRADTVIRDINLSLPTVVSVRHIMRVDRLTDIEQLGVTFTPDDI